MPMSAANEQSYHLPGVMDVDALDAVRDWLGGAIERGDVELNASEVTRVVTNALLMLVSAAHSAAKSNFAVSICDPSQPLLEAIERLGMGEIFSKLLKGN